MGNIKFIILLLFMTTMAYAGEKEITICSFDWPPHHSETLKDGGYTAILIREIFEPQGYKVNKMFLPWKRAQIYAKEGKKCDAITEIYFNEERLNYFWFGAPYSVHEVFTVALKSHPVKKYSSIRELEGYVIGHNRGGSLSKEFDAADYLKKKAINGYKYGIEELVYKQIDFFVSARSVAFFEASKIGKQDLIHTVGKPLQTQYVHMAFSKKNPENIYRLQDYNEGLFKLLRSGRYAQIMLLYGF